MSTLLSPTTFLRLGGAVLLALGLIGFTGITNNIEFFNLDAGENIAHTVLGIVGLAVGFGTHNLQLHRWLVVLLAVVALVAGIYGFTLPAGSFANGNLFGVANLENPADNVLHIVVGIWAAAAAYANRAPSGQMTPRAA